MNLVVFTVKFKHFAFMALFDRSGYEPDRKLRLERKLAVRGCRLGSNLGHCGKDKPLYQLYLVSYRAPAVLFLDGFPHCTRKYASLVGVSISYT